MGRAVTVTDSERNRVESLDDETVVGYYGNYLGDDRGSFMANPLAVFDAEGNFVLRSITETSEDGATSFFMGEVPQGRTVQVSMTTVPEILAAAKITAVTASATYPETSGPAGTRLVSCAARKVLLGTDAPKEAAGFQVDPARRTMTMRAAHRAVLSLRGAKRRVEREAGFDPATFCLRNST
jgi:hypothetical protein